MQVKITDGNLRFALIVERRGNKPFAPNDEQLDALLAIPGAVEAGSTGLHTCSVVFEVSSPADFDDELVEQKAEEIRKALARF